MMLSMLISPSAMAKAIYPESGRRRKPYQLSKIASVGGTDPFIKAEKVLNGFEESANCKGAL